MRILFIQPAVGHKGGGAVYPKTWIMEPLALAVLSALTPRRIERFFMDDRLGEVDYSADADVVAMPVECYTAARSYEIASRFRVKGAKVVLGGFHVKLNQDEAAAHADAIILGDAETTWGEVIDDLETGTLKPRYVGCGGVFCPIPDRGLYAGRNYGRLNLVETSRGCSFNCEFCSVTKFFERRYTPRPLDEVMAEVRSLEKRIVFFVDDNLAMDVERLKELCRRMIPVRMHWVGQLSIHSAKDDELLALMAKSGCAGVLIGFESLDGATLADMGKRVNSTNSDYAAAIENLRRHHLSIRWRRSSVRSSSQWKASFSSPRSTTLCRFPEPMSTRGSSAKGACSTRNGGSTRQSISAMSCSVRRTSPRRAWRRHAAGTVSSSTRRSRSSAARWTFARTSMVS